MLKTIKCPLKAASFCLSQAKYETWKTNGERKKEKRGDTRDRTDLQERGN